MDELEVKKYYQWINGQFATIVEEYVAEDSDFIYFKSDRKVLKTELQQLFYDVIDPENPPIPIENVISSMMDFPEHLLGNPTPTFNQPIQKVISEPEDFMHTILKKQKKLEVIKANLWLNLEIPRYSVVDMLSTMYDDEEVIESLFTFVKKRLNDSGELDILIREKIAIYYEESINNNK